MQRLCHAFFSRLVLPLGMVALALLAAQAARASTITVFTNFGANHSFNTANLWTVAGVSGLDDAIAIPFTASSTADLADAVLPLGYYGSNTALTVDLESNSGGTPGSILASLTQVGTIPYTPPRLGNLRL